MTTRHFFLLILLFVTAVFMECSNEAPALKTNSKVPPDSTATQASKTAPPTTAQQEPPAEKTPEEQPKNELKEPTTTLPEKKNVKTKRPSAPSTPKIHNPEGNPTGYITRDNVSLQSQPSENASKTRSIKRYEEVMILETKWTDEAGATYDVPQWYKVQCGDKKVGWVVARSVALGGGG